MLLPSGAAHDVQMVDVSDTGLCLKTPLGFDSGLLCAVTFSVPLKGGHANVTAMAQTVYSLNCGHEGFKTGMLLVESAAKSNTENLHKFIHQH